MRIEKIEIRGFGKFDSLALSFEKGINIVFGGNESGKTSLQAFVKGMLYGLKGGRLSKDGSLPPVKKYKPWNSKDYNGFMEYRLDNGELFRAGRNFATNSARVFDSLFNDMSGEFEVSKEKGLLFAEKHLGLNETCFEKTVFIKQMESRIDDDGCRELISRLTNLNQTGFEDISFKRAQDALKEAIIKHVGTGKTSTRPLDVIVARIEELKGARKAFLDKRNSLFSIEKELNDAFVERDNAQKRKNLIAKSWDVLELRSRLESLTRYKLELEQLGKEINSKQEELGTVLKRLEDINTAKVELAKFSRFTLDDADSLNMEYQNLAFLEDERIKLERDLDLKKKALAELEDSIRQFEGLKALDGSLQGDLTDYVRELEILKKEREKSSLEVLNEKLKNARSKSNRMLFNIIFSAVFAVAFAFLAAISNINPAFLALTACGFISAAIFSILKIKSEKELSGLIDEKKMAFAYINDLTDRISKGQERLNEVFEMLGVKDIEELKGLKSVYEAKENNISRLRLECESLGNGISGIDGKISALKNAITEQLSSAGISLNGSMSLKDGNITEFKYGVRKYASLEPSFNFVLQRVEDLNQEIASLYNKALLIGGIDCKDVEKLTENIAASKEKVNSLEMELKGAIDELRALFLQQDIEFKDFDTYLYGIMNIPMEKIQPDIKNNLDKANEEFNRVQIRITEHETMVRSLTEDDESIQRLEEEISELEIRKNQLEDTNISLRTALEVLTEASSEIQRDFAPLLNARMGEILRRITGGKYKDIRADDLLHLKAVTPETGDINNALSFSGGTVDQMYLALRLAVAELIGGGSERLPVIMDEVFAQYDDMRTRETFKLLHELSEERQIIFFTCKAREVDIAKEVCGAAFNLIELV